ncbi:hypothetical protein [Capillimicrobium parvum]|uniref:hypothetical protein n=1 Tax=Capillimicrobium parvum TaxID=2884022 RepID=UPI00216B516D|nr:hypothetical protein [Capillimicrobium parvum]
MAPPALRLIDPRTLQVLGETTLPNAPTPPGTPEFQNFTGGGYFFLDGDDLPGAPRRRATSGC